MMFGLLPRLYIYGAAALLAASVATWAIWSIRRDAQHDIIRKIERTEDDARRKAVEGARSVDACYDIAGGVWDRSAGTCRLIEGKR